MHPSSPRMCGGIGKNFGRGQNDPYLMKLATCMHIGLFPVKRANRFGLFVCSIAPAISEILQPHIQTRKITVLQCVTTPCRFFEIQLHCYFDEKPFLWYKNCTCSRWNFSMAKQYIKSNCLETLMFTLLLGKVKIRGQLWWKLFLISIVIWCNAVLFRFCSAFEGTRVPGLDSSMGSSSSELETTLGEVGLKLNCKLWWTNQHPHD